MAIEALNSNENKEFDKVLSSFKEELKILQGTVLLPNILWSKAVKSKENLNEEPETVKLKNGYEVKKYWSNLVFNFNSETYWLTIKKVNWEFIFDAKTEWRYSDDLFDELRKKHKLDTTKDDNVDKINLYLASCGLELISDKGDIDTLQNLLNNLPDNIVKENN